MSSGGNGSPAVAKSALSIDRQVRSAGARSFLVLPFHIKWPLFSAKILRNAPVFGEEVVKKRPFVEKYAGPPEPNADACTAALVFNLGFFLLCLTLIISGKLLPEAMRRSPPITQIPPSALAERVEMPRTSLVPGAECALLTVSRAWRHVHGHSGGSGSQALRKSACCSAQTRCPAGTVVSVEPLVARSS